MPAKSNARMKLLDAALTLVREKGYSATRVDDICAAAGVSKGSFFHHFAGKDDLALAAINHWHATTSALFEAAPYHEPDDPLQRLLAYIDFRKALVQGSPAEFCCFAGTLVQEAHSTHPALRQATRDTILGHAQTLESDLSAALAQHVPEANQDAGSLARHFQAVLQGGFILAKASGGQAAVIEHLDHLRRYLLLLLNQHPMEV